MNEFVPADPMDEPIVRRLKAIRRLADNAGTPQEAAAAAAKYAELVTKYGLEEARLSIETGSPLGGFGHAEINSGFDSWKILLATGLAQGTMCQLVLVGKNTDRSRFDVIGHRDNVNAVLDLFSDLSRLFIRLADEAWSVDRRSKGGVQPDLFAQDQPLSKVRIPKDEFAESFLYGASRAVYDRMMEQLRAMRGDADHGVLIVVEDKVQQTKDGLYPPGTLMKPDPLRGDHRRGFEAGYKVGSAVDLSTLQKLGDAERARLA